MNVFLAVAHAVALLWTFVPIFVPLYVPATVTAVSCLCVWLGSWRAAEEGKDEDGTSLKSESDEAMTTRDAYMLPFTGSAVLLSLYVAFKFFGKDMVNKLLSAYFVLLGTIAIAGVMYSIVGHLFPKTWREHCALDVKFSLPILAEPVEFSVSAAEFVLVVPAAAVAIASAVTKVWLLNNIVGVAFCLQGIELLRIGSYRNGVLMLSGLFLYDIFWVFGTDVMVTVAKSFDAPIKLLFPKTFPVVFDGTQECSLLGLGDIIIPGAFIAETLRFDRKNRRVFYFTVVGYFVGIVTTLVVMNVFNHAQPALLYLVPGCIAFSLLGAASCGRVKELWEFASEKEGGEEDANAAAAKKQKKTPRSSKKKA